ncbi:Protein tap1 [Castilleja foliolosa]|uniref:Protein tap1 n=1 Tax=Castilleja foliolosa TaxID=1961234 RepID=A0ABD3DCB9_9LAMI
MERKEIKLTALLLLIIMSTFSFRSTTAHYPPGTCIKRCLSECQLSGVDVSVCIKYCPVHCLPQHTSTKHHYCNLGCMLDECAKFTTDEKNMSDCVSKCNKSQCKIDL